MLQGYATRYRRRIRFAVIFAVLLLVGQGIYMLWDRVWSGNHWISTYGRVMDQAGKPVVGAEVRISIGYDQIFIPTIFGAGQDKWRDYWVTTDSNGEFSFWGTTGKRILINGLKYRGDENYQTGADFSDWPNTSIEGRSKRNPAIVWYWNKTISPKVIHWSHAIVDYGDAQMRLPPRHMDTYFSGPRDRGDIVFSVFDRSEKLIVQVPEGGVIETDDQPFSQAPQSGYSHNAAVAKPSGQGPVINRFYFMVRRESGDAYGGMEVLHGSDVQHKLKIQVRYVLNTAGGRELRD